jgi:hypothetical protein
MANDIDKIYKQALEVADNPMVFFIEDIVGLLPIGKTSFYKYFPLESDEMNALKEKLDDNRVAMKVKLRNKLSQGDKAAEVLALYKLIATDSERKALSMTHVDHTSKDKPINGITLIDA